LAGVIATQRLAKLAKNVAAEASNFLMGRTFLDIDMLRAADLLGMERRQAEAIRDLERGQFLGLGPAIARRPVLVRVGAVRTGTNNAAPALLPLPDADAGADLLLNLEPVPSRSSRSKSRDVQPVHGHSEETRPSTSLGTSELGVPAASDLIRTIEAPSPVPDLPALDQSERATRIGAILANLADGFGGQPAPALYQEFTVGCRMAGIAPVPPLADFRRLLALALAGIDGEDGWAEPLALAAALPEEMLAPFLRIARAAREGAPCPDDAELARIYGTASLGRVKRMLGHMEERGVIVIRTDLAGGRSIALPHLGWTSSATEAGKAA
jgi:hypothetical protein